MIAQYKVRYYIDADEYTAEGLVYGKTYTEAVSNIVEYFGEDETVEISIKAPTDDSGMDTLIVFEENEVPKG